MTAFGVVKALAVKKSWGQVKHCDLYLRGELEEQKQSGTIKTENTIYDGLNCDRENFTNTCMLYMKRYGQKKVKAYEYVQSFSPKDRQETLTPELAHKLGLEFANRFFGAYPCLVVTHIDTGHIHNQILVGNVDVDHGKCLKVDPKTLREMKAYTGMQCERNGLHHSIFTEEKKSKEVQRSNTEMLMKKQGKVPAKEHLIAAIEQTRDKAGSLNELIQILEEQYQIKVRTTRNTISFLHPQLKHPVRGKRLGEAFTKAALEDVLWGKTQDGEKRKLQNLLEERNGLQYKWWQLLNKIDEKKATQKQRKQRRAELQEEINRLQKEYDENHVINEPAYIRSGRSR